VTIKLTTRQLQAQILAESENVPMRRLVHCRQIGGGEQHRRLPYSGLESQGSSSHDALWSELAFKSNVIAKSGHGGSKLFHVRMKEFDLFLRSHGETSRKMCS